MGERCLKAVIFDFDGVIVDTEPLHYRSFQVVLEPLGLGYSWQEYVDRYMGFDDRDAFIEAFRAGGRSLDQSGLEELIALKASLFQDVVTEGVSAYPGVVALISALSAEVPLAICSGALRSDIEPILRILAIENAFTVMVTAEEVAASKPDPASYVLAVRKLATAFPDRGITAACCVAIEDTPAGIVSASGAGIPVVAVTNSYSADHLSKASRIVSSLADLTIADFKTIVTT
ncbi:HAD family phosphatase [Geobacter pelophilus]|uniref:HAD family phosphatase n=1 Tax=Geoanaerobacter pelophilus TaxID=60036 RepID=A0AAW4KZZ4_9BACT|nr:HAD family phosphatase [Geoanaerobacter pelophilus]MBT0664369.1 HAD family phosphatase [Geoanaerobacter pelophilus]